MKGEERKDQARKGRENRKMVAGKCRQGRGEREGKGTSCEGETSENANLTNFYPFDASAGINCRRVSVRLSQVVFLLKRLNMGSCKQRRTIAQDVSFLTPKMSAKLKRGHPQRRCQTQVR